MNPDRLNLAVGNAAAWLILPVVLVQFTTVLFRYVFGISFVALQEAVLYMHGLFFLLPVAATLVLNKHVRVEVFYASLTTRGKAVVDFIGTVGFALPFCSVFVVMALPYVQSSWLILEGSREPGGLPGVFLLKTLMIAAVVLLAFQLLALAWRSIKMVLVVNPDTDPNR